MQMEEKEILKKFIERIDKLIEEKRGQGLTIKEDWSENKYNFMKKYGHI